MQHIQSFCEFITEAILSKNDFIKLSKQKWNNLYDYKHTDFKGMKIPTRIECKLHGPFNETPLNHIKGIGCPDCSGSKKFTNLINQVGYDPIVVGTEDEKTFYTKRNAPSKHKNLSGRNIAK